MLIEFTKEEIQAYLKWSSKADSDGWAIDQLSNLERDALSSFNEKLEKS